MSKKVLGDVHPEKHFWLADGKSLKNIIELKEALLEMHDHTYNHHVNEHRNDFHNWVRDVHGDQKLAAMLHEAEGKLKAAEAIDRRIGELFKKRKKPIKRKIKKLEEPVVEKPQISSRAVSVLAVLVLILVIFFIGMGSYATSISGAVVGTPQAEEIQFLGLTGIIGLFLLFFMVAKRW